MDSVNCEVLGLEELTRKLKQLERLGKQKSLVYKAIFFATKPMLDEVKQRASKADKAYYRYYNSQGNKSRVLQKPGKLKKSIKRKRVKLPDSVGVGIYSAPIKSGGASKYSVFYWRFLEYGTPRMAAIPFIRPAFDHKKLDSLDKFKQRYREYVQAIIDSQLPDNVGP